MILIIGAEASGKRAYAEMLGYAKADMAAAVLDERPVVYDVQRMVEREPAEAMALIAPLAQKKIVICNEVGCGVIPADRQGREAREQTGRLCIELAKRAEKVIRMVCGMPTVIKGERR